MDHRAGQGDGLNIHKDEYVWKKGPCFPDAEEEEKDCWTRHADMYSGGYANGHSSKYDLAGAKEKCLQLSGCKAISCTPDTKSCTVRASSGLKPSSAGEVSFTHDCK